MPVIYDTTPIIPVPNETVLAKYMDLTKFLSLLINESLFFCRLDKLEDQFEGTTAKKNYEGRINYQKQLRKDGFFEVPPTDNEIITSVESLFEFDRKIKGLICISCWNKFETESAALWKIYSDYGKGIMIKTSAGRLENSLQQVNEEIYLSSVNYIDHENDWMPDSNTTYPIIHKNEAYSYETEVRLFHQVDSDATWTYDWSKEKVQEGKYFKINLDILIEEIIVGPFSPVWFIEIIHSLTDKYSLKVPVRKSKLSR
ncbi:MAG: DUF2971 domain-containing protein [Flavobacterium sp.]|nr:MAG: DUF2971 domain-containing protein [Flavobacterium sp.]